MRRLKYRKRFFVAVYITDIASFLPNDPVPNNQMENILGLINSLPSRTRKIILRNNGIVNRHYAIDPDSGIPTHTNAQLTAQAVRGLNPYEGFSIKDIEYICCGTSSPDQIMPGHGAMVQGELGIGPCEVVSTSGICLAGLTALKNTYMNVLSGFSQNGVATGSELASTFIRAQMGQSIHPNKVKNLEKMPSLAFEADFLRWMLSDGAGAAFLSRHRSENRPALYVNWIEMRSYAHEFETCMYAGAVKQKGHGLTGWRIFSSLHEAVDQGAFLIKQEVKLLNDNIVTVSVDRALKSVMEKYDLHPEEISWFLPHYSSDYFREPLFRGMAQIGFEIPQDRWFTNLAHKGNTGSASFYIILEEFFHSGRLKKGDKILCFVPESGRFSVGYMLLTVV